jgi:hypothetical protein
MSEHTLPRLPDKPLSREQCVWLIRNTPDFLMEYRHDILLSFDRKTRDGGIVDAVRQEYRNTAAWLEYYLLDRCEVLPDLTFTNKVHYKPLADRAMAFYDLAKELYPRFVWAQEQNLRPLEWMVQCEIQLCEAALKNSYYEGTAQPTGKSERYKKAVQYYQWMENAEKLEFGRAGTVSAIELLEMGASYVAKSDFEFRKTHYWEYCQKQKRLFRVIRDSPLLAVVATPDGDLKVLGRGQGTRSKSKKRGFGS